MNYTSTPEEIDNFIAFARRFPKADPRALLYFLREVAGKKALPYKFKNRNFVIECLDIPAATIVLNFEEVLIEDGRRPRTVVMAHVQGEALDRQKTVTQLDGSQRTIPVLTYRLAFVNPEGNQHRISTFTFRNMAANIQYWNYNLVSLEPEKNMDKLPWRLMAQPLEAFIEKARALGTEALNPAEIQCLPVFCVIYELIQFYLSPNTTIGIGYGTAAFSQEESEQFVYSQEDARAVARVLAQGPLEEFGRRLEASFMDKPGFCRYLVRFFSHSESEVLYRYLGEALTECTKPCPEINRSYSVYHQYGQIVQNQLNDFFLSNQWYGTYPMYRKVERPRFMKDTSVYTSQYDYINPTQKVYYLDIIESITSEKYVITAVLGSVMGKEQDMKTRRHCALECFLTDGAKRSGRVLATVAFEENMSESLVHAAIKFLEAQIQGELHI